MLRKQKPIKHQICRHLLKRNAINASEGWKQVEGSGVGRSTWFCWMSGKSSISVDWLEKLLAHLGLMVLIVDKKTGRTHTDKTVELK